MFYDSHGQINHFICLLKNISYNNVGVEDLNTALQSLH